MRAAALIAILSLPALAQEPATCAIGGAVTDIGTDKPVVRARVIASSATYSRLGLTDDHGNFCFEHLSPADYQLFVQKSGYSEYHHPVILAVEADSPLKPLTLRLTRYGGLSGTVLDADGDLVPGASVTIWQRTKQGPGRVDDITTDANGVFRLSGLSPGTYYLSAKADDQERGRYPAPFADTQGEVIHEAEVETFYSSSLSFAGAAPVQVKPGQSADSLMLPLRKIRLRRVTGRLVDLPAAGLLTYNCHSETDLDTFGAIPVATDGSFAKVDLPPARYTVELSDGKRVIAHKDVDLTVGDALNITLDRIETADIAAVIRTEGKGPAFRPTLRWSDLLLVQDGSKLAIPLVATGDSTYRFPDVAQGVYQLRADLAQEHLYLKSITYRGETQTQNKIDLRVDRPGGLEIVLSSNVAEVDGKAKLPEDGAENLTVILADDKHVVHQTHTDQKGRFRIPSVAPGKYRLYAIEGFDDDNWGSPQLQKALEENSVELEVKENEKKQVSVTAISADEWAAALKKAGG